MDDQVPLSVTKLQRDKDPSLDGNVLFLWAIENYPERGRQ